MKEETGDLQELNYELLFSAPDKDGAVVSIRVHKLVKDVLTRIAREEGLDGVSELVRHIIASFLLSKLNVVKPEPKLLTPPMYVNININKTVKGINNAERELAKIKIDDKVEEAYEFIEKYKKGIIRVTGNNNYARKIRRDLAEAIALALKYGLEDEYSRLKVLLNEIQLLLD
ncbi:hypothetical protein [Caldivirga maquilingensis]|uniref:CopG domain protein DNA-binding domain protein n=1 Tax=Caldivirga maquilingensis (strain ATCC 700844 / DSM 13496 / JCM 10307 / IC-167) TaxID=397948 RepID=A8MBP2_CALMQ|nr:hypothetical protein [Caldivirga maquilingensis]ABW02775.1 conserved hypothetical protein [Caldivirga maquilingensis IC-167]